MREYDFHNILSPDEFEDLAKDIIETKYNTPFRTFKRGKDLGVDFENTSGSEIIIGQVKCYQNNFKSLFNTLRSIEFPKVKKRNPHKYILVTSVELSKTEFNKILELFEGHIRADDLLDRIMLNKLLSKPEYHSIEIKHYKLWITSTNILQEIINKNINRGINNRSNSELRKIIKSNITYVQHSSFEYGLHTLKKHKVLVISGSPGIGKTTLARALASYFLSKEDYTDFVYISQSINEAYQTYNNNPDSRQVFFYDDFLGKFKLEDSIHSKELYTLNNFIEDLQSTNNAVLIITTRDYVLKQGQIKFKDALSNENYSKKIQLDLKSLSLYFKAKILFNHLYFSSLDKKYIDLFLYEDNYYKILYHENYTPRLINEFINNFGTDVVSKDKNTSSNPHFFLHQFKKYLDDPYSYWINVFHELPRASQLILMTVFISCEPIPVEFLQDTFNSIYNEYTKKYNDIIYSPDTFENCLRELNTTFIDIEKHHNSYLLVVTFQTPFINDLLLRYLKENDHFVEIFIRGARFFNQLTFIFSTKKTKYSEFTDKSYLIEIETIVIPFNLITTYEEKILTDFDNLLFSNVEERTHTDQKDMYNDLDDIEVLKLLYLCDLFDLQTNVRVRSFIQKRFENLIEIFKKEDNKKIVPNDGMIYLPSLIDNIYPYLQGINALELISIFHQSITFSEEYLSFINFKRIFKNEFESYLSEHIKNIRREIPKLIIEDIIYYEDELEESVKADMLYDNIDELFKIYSIKRTKAFDTKLASTIGMFRPSKSELKKELEERELEYKIQDQHYELEKSKIKHLFDSLQSDDSYSLNDVEIEEYLLSHALDSEIFNKIKPYISREFYHPTISNLIDDRISLDILIEYLKHFKEISVKTEFYSRLQFIYIEKTFTFPSVLVKNEIISFLQKLAFDTYFSDTSEINATHIEKLFKNESFPNLTKEIIDDSLLKIHPIFQKNKRWFRFFNRDFQAFLAASYIHFSEENKELFFQNTFLNYHSDRGEISSIADFCYDLDRNYFIKYFALPYLQELKTVLEKKSLLGNPYVEIFDVNCNFQLSKKKLNWSSYGFGEKGSNSFGWLLVEYYNLPLNRYILVDSLIYFEDIAYPSFGNPDVFIPLFFQDFMTDESQKYFEVDFNKFIDNEEFYNLLEKQGIISAIQLGYNALSLKIEELQKTLQSSNS